MFENRYFKFYNCFVLAVLFLLVFTGCENKQPTDSLRKFNEVIINLRQNDGFLSKEEMDSLKNMVLESKNSRLAKWKDSENQVNEDSLASYICKILERGNIVQNKNCIIDPVSEHFNINFFIKNTANMDGYIKPRSQFQDALFGLLADLKSGFHGNDINLHYVNTVVTNRIPFDNSDAIENYIYKIDRNKFAEFGKKNKGNRGSTDFDLIFGHVLETVNKNSIAILAADFIFSPGKGVNVNDYLEKQRNSIRVKFTQKIEELNLAVLVLKMESDFDGNYWNRKSDNTGRLTAKRPYYIWFIGLPQHLTKIAKNERLFVTLKSNGFTGDRIIFESSNAEKQPEFKIGASDKYSFNNKNHNIKVKRLRKGEKYNFILDVNFNNDAFRDSVFFADVDNYEVKDYELTINAKPPKNFKHRLALSSEKITQGPLKISVIEKIPKWVNEVNSTDDINIKKDISEQAKTYGFKRIVEGVYSAFYPTISMDEHHVLQTVNLSIQLED